MNEADILKLVKEKTRWQHDQLERLLPFSKTALSLDSYRDALITFLGLFEPIESAITQVELPVQLETERRRRSYLLVRDLRSLGLPDARIESLPRCSDIPPQSSMAQTLGTMYVLEGSTLGGHYISTLVYEQLGLTEQTGCAVFHSYGADVGAMWRRFCEVVQIEVAGSKVQQQFILSAQSTFATFENWMRRRKAPHA
jgi:heme oxygenase